MSADPDRAGRTAQPEPSARPVVVRAADGLALHARLWSAPDPRAVVVLSHGFGEHGGVYDHVARAIVPAAGVDFLATDLRGHGQSPGRRGVVRHYDELTADLIAAFDYAGRERPGLPRLVLGHSNGGQVALRAALDPRVGPEIAGLILSNPSLRLAVDVPAWKLALARLLLRHAPGVTLSAGLRPEQLSRDPAMQARRRNDRLIHGRINAPFFFGMVEGGPLVARSAGAIRQPVLMILSGADTVVAADASRELFDRLGSVDKTLLLFPAMRHEPLNELGRDKVLADIATWLNRLLSSTPAAPSA